jgi:phosphate transport system protein
VDEREVRIEEDCLKILALHQPVASDLRRAAAILKINNDLERIGDLAVNIAEVAQRLLTASALTIPEKLQQMATIARAMVGAALDAFVQMDVVAAAGVCSRDDEVDRLKIEVERELLELAKDDIQLSSCFQLCLVAEQLERIADHATNIAEDAIYLVDGEIARHRHSSASRLRLHLSRDSTHHDETAHPDHRGRSSSG